MKNSIYILQAFVLALVMVSCQEPESPEPNLEVTKTYLAATFQFINAASDAPALEFYVNNEKLGLARPFMSGLENNIKRPITTNGVGANTNIRVKGVSYDWNTNLSSSPIGGSLGSNDLIYRAGNTSTNNFAATNGAFYTFIALDTINRPAPVRKLNAKNFGDTTYVNLANGTQISVVERSTFTTAQKALTVPIGTVPLGQTDPGGIRFVLLTDSYSALAADKAGLRLVNAVPNSNIWARLKPASGTTITLGTNSGYILAFPTFTPSVGSRSTTSSFSAQTIATSGLPITYTLEVSTNNYTTIDFSLPGVTLAPGKFYTVVVGGQKGKTDTRAIKASITLQR